MFSKHYTVQSLTSQSGRSATAELTTYSKTTEPVWLLERLAVCTCAGWGREAAVVAAESVGE